MFLVINNNTNACVNLAIEEVFTENDVTEPILMLWRNENAVVIGRHQNTFEEVNIDYAKSNNIEIIRRNSGGGAVYHDLGNINFSIIVNKQQRDYDNLDFFVEPIIDFLSTLNIKVYRHGRNDIIFDGKKISGNAKYIAKKNVLHHGTLLFDVNIDILTNVLTPNEDKIKSKSIKSVRSRVYNIKNVLPMDKNDFWNKIVRYFESLYLSIPIEDEILRKVNLLVENKYSTWDWNFGFSPKYDYKTSIKTKNATLNIYFMVENGFISSASISGDFFSLADIFRFEKTFIGLKYSRDIIIDHIRNTDIEKYFIGISKEDIIKFV